jgi:hypothetical protein
MKKIKNLVGLKGVATAMIAFIMILASCNKSNDLTSSLDSQSLNNEATMDAQQDETADIATSALNANAVAVGGRVEDRDDRLACATVTKDSTNTKDSGTITLTFNGDCTDDDGNVRKGKMIITWLNGRWYVPGSVHTIKLEGYSINGVGIEGTRTVTNISTTESPLTWTISGSHKSTWPDGTTAQRTVNKTRQWVRSSTNPREDKIIISQTNPAVSAASGINRHGNTYSVSITTPLQYFASCGRRVKIPVVGIKVVTVGNPSTGSKTYTVDFGDGTCDNKYTVTKDGVTKEFIGKNDSSKD